MKFSLWLNLLLSLLLLLAASLPAMARQDGLASDTCVVNALARIQLTPYQLALAPDLEKPDPFRLPVVDDALQHCWRLEPITLALADSAKASINSYSTSGTNGLNWQQLVLRALETRKRLWQNFSTQDRQMLLENLPSLYKESDDVADLDIFTLEERREASTDSFRLLIEKIKQLPASNDWRLRLHDLITFAYSLKDTTAWEGVFGTLRHTSLAGVTGAIIGWQETTGGIVVIGSTGRNTYSGEFAAIVDLGGDDEYLGRFAGTSEKVPMGLVVDFSGNDVYRADSLFSCGAAIDGAAVLIDYSGDDRYIGNQWVQGAAILGAAALEDRSGFDVYDADGNAQGCAGWGVATLHDKSGNDLYRVHVYGQGVGLVAGFGTLLDEGGDDQYLATPRYTDVLRYQDHSITLSQGFGYGLRPHLSGGIGLLLEETGSDIYYSDIYGQGASYWYALGGLIDRAGNDRYIAYQYAQGSGIHISVGALIDSSGNDSYESKGVSQGCGHDLGTGLLHDYSGNDSYICSELSQGAGSANGFGIMIDDAGDDIYANRNSGMVMGYGNPRRDYGSIGLFLDKSGNDRYADEFAADGRWWTRGIRGIGCDVSSGDGRKKP